MESKADRRREERNFPPLFGLDNFRLAGRYFQWCCLLINYYYDNSPERSSVGWGGWTPPMSNLIWGPQPSSPSLQLLPIWAQHLCCAGHLHNYEYQLLRPFLHAGCSLPPCMYVIYVSLWVSSRDCINALDVNAAAIKSVFLWMNRSERG